MKRTVKVAAGQLGPASATRAETVERIVALIEEAGREGVKVLAFPELALSPYFAVALHADLSPFVEETFPSDETAPIVEAIVKAGTTTVLPYAERDGGLLYNSAAIIGSDGSIVGKYRKNHIPGQFEPGVEGEFFSLEKRYFAPSNLGFPVYPSPAGPLGVAICYDRRFPETYRCYALQEARLLACCYNTPVIDEFGGTIESSRERQELVVRAAALSNGVPIIASGKAGIEGGRQYTGWSCVIDHVGTVLARAETDGDELAAAEIDLDAGEEMDLFENRRPELYGIISQTREAVALGR